MKRENDMKEKNTDCRLCTYCREETKCYCYCSETKNKVQISARTKCKRFKKDLKFDHIEKENL